MQVSDKTEIGTGIYLCLDNDVYHSQKHAISNSGLGDIIKSPYHYWSKHLNPDRPEEKEKPGQLEGTLAHCAILEPEKFNRRYAVGPDCNRNTKAWKEFSELCSENELIPIKKDQYEVAMRQAEQVRRISDVDEALCAGNAEVSAFCEDPEYEVICRVRPDWVHDTKSGDVILLDVKTCGDASPEDFARQIARKGYHRQDAMYSDVYNRASGKSVLAFVFVAVESSYPYSASVVMLDDESRAAGYRSYREAIEVYAKCKERDEWPGYSSGVEVVSLPKYML